MRSPFIGVITGCLLLCVPGTLRAETLASAHYALSAARIVNAGGGALSPNFILSKVRCGSITGGIAQSPNFSLDATIAEKVSVPQAPSIDLHPSLTKVPLLMLHGTKESGTSIVINGSIAVPFDYRTSWSYQVTLAEGTNTLSVTARNRRGLVSLPVVAYVILDTVAPLIAITSPLDGVTVNTPTLVVHYTLDGVEKTSQFTLAEGLNTVTVTDADQAGNTASASINVTLDTRPQGTLIINNGDEYTTSLSVDLVLSAWGAGASVTQMQFSNNNTDWSSPEPYATAKTWTLDNGLGEKTVYVMFKDSSSRWSAVITDTIILTDLVTDTVTYQYDDLNRLENVSAGNIKSDYAYDEVGNITKKTTEKTGP